MSTSIANPPSVDIKDAIVSDTALVFGTDIFVSTMPSEPDNCVCLYDTGGFPQERYDYEKPTIQIRIRNNSYVNGYNQARDLKYLIGTGDYNNSTINGIKYVLIRPSSDILYLGKDEHNRFQFTVNFQIHRSGN
jgi:hypothetical protein